MSVASEKLPIYDDRVNYIIRSLGDGVKREELAVEFKHNDYRSLDMYMRRRNFTWDSDAQNYKPVVTRINKKDLLLEDTHSGKVWRIIKSFKEGNDSETVATEYGFKDHRELAEYMTTKGYEWKPEEGNYVRKLGIQNKEQLKSEVPSNNKKEEEKGYKDKQTIQKDDELLHLVRSLYEKLDIAADPIVDNVPRYLVKGIAKTKSVQLSHLLHQLLEDFSYEKNITQRQILETAIIDFFRKYGYKHEVDTLLKS